MSKTLKFVDGDMVRLYTNENYTYVTDNEKVRQDVACIITTAVRSTTGLGLGLETLIGESTDNPTDAYAAFPLILEFQTRVRVGLNRLKSSQRSYHFSQRSPKELIYDFSPVRLWQSSEDPRNVQFSVDILTEDGRTSFSINGLVRR